MNAKQMFEEVYGEIKEDSYVPYGYTPAPLQPGGDFASGSLYWDDNIKAYVVK